MMASVRLRVHVSRPHLRTVAWMVAGAALPAGSASALVQVRGSVPNADVALLILAGVLLVAASGRRGPVVVAAGSAALSYDYFHTFPYHSFTIANHNDVASTLVLGLVALVIGLAATRAARAYEELVLIVGVAVLSQAVPGPARLLVDHRGLDTCLAVLMFVTALSIPLSAVVSLGEQARRLLVSLAVAAVALPALSWAVSRLVAAAALAPRGPGGGPRSGGDRGRSRRPRSRAATRVWPCACWS